MKKTILIPLMIVFVIGANAQEYKGAIGGRLGPTVGASFKYFLSENGAVELIGGTRFGGLSATALYEIHNDNPFSWGGSGYGSERNFRWFYGFGGHVGFYNVGPGNNYYYRFPGASSLSTGNYTVVGIDGIFGVEYIFPDLPFAASIDVKPSINFTPGFWVWGDEIALTARYTF